MTPVYCNYVHDWLMRVNTQYDKETPKKIEAADYERARQSLGSNVINNYFFASRQPAYGLNIDNSTTTHIHNTHVHAPKDTPKTSKEKKKTEKEKTNWKAIATIGVVSTAVAGISLFVYVRLSKAAEGARNYLENTKHIHTSSMMTIGSPNLVGSKINKIAEVQLKIDKKAVDKITNYKYSILTSLAGTLAITSGITTIFAAAPALATAGTTAVVAGGVLNAIAVLFAIYNCAEHWSDEKDGQKEFSKVQPLIPNVIEDLQFLSTPPSYEESEAAIRNQRANPRNIYPDLSAELFPSAPPYEGYSDIV